MRSFGEVFDRWWAVRTPVSLVSLRDAVVSAEPDDHAVRDGLTLLHMADATAARDRLLKGMPRWFLSPAAHNLLALAHQNLGDDKAATRERALSGLGLRLIQDSGDGTRHLPWAVLRVADEYDLCLLQRRQVISQHTTDGVVDCLGCADGSRLWFAQHQPTTTSSEPGP